MKTASSGYVDVMELLPLRGRLRGIRQIGQGLGTLDSEVFEAIAESPSPLLDATMPRLSRAADHSKLWLAIAAALVAIGGPSAQRGAARGVVSLAVTSLFTNQVAKRVWRRPRPNRMLVPLARRSHRFADVELAAVRSLGERGGVRGRRRPGEPAAGPGPGAAGRLGGPVPGRDRGALSR